MNQFYSINAVFCWINEHLLNKWVLLNKWTLLCWINGFLLNTWIFAEWMNHILLNKWVFCWIRWFHFAELMNVWLNKWVLLNKWNFCSINMYFCWILGLLAEQMNHILLNKWDSCWIKGSYFAKFMIYRWINGFKRTE